MHFTKNLLKVEIESIKIQGLGAKVCRNPAVNNLIVVPFFLRGPYKLGCLYPKTYQLFCLSFRLTLQVHPSREVFFCCLFWSEQHLASSIMNEMGSIFGNI